MRIWYEEELHGIANCPGDTAILIQGIINDDPGLPLIVIQLYVSSESISQTGVLFTHNPTMRSDERPTADDIQAKYRSKIAKLRDRISRTKYEDLTKFF